MKKKIMTVLLITQLTIACSGGSKDASNPGSSSPSSGQSTAAPMPAKGELTRAVLRRDGQAARALLERGADPNEVIEVGGSADMNANITPLLIAAIQGDEDTAQVLRQYGARSDGSYDGWDVSDFELANSRSVR